MPVTDYTGARKARVGYTHLMSIKWNGVLTSWENRVTQWGLVNREISTPTRAFSGGNQELKFVDTDYDMWGSFKGVNGSEILWSNIAITSKLAGPDGTFSLGGEGDVIKFGQKPMGAFKFGERTAVNDILTTGMVIDMTVEENELSVSLYDDINTIRDAKFIWDYLNLKTSWGGDYYGTVHRILSGTSFTMQEAPDKLLRVNLALLGQNEQWRTYTEKWKRLGNLGVIGTDSVLPGDIIKFHKTNFADADAGSLLLGSRQYAISYGSFVINSGVGTFGTFHLDKVLIGVKPGDFVYKKKPLIFEGNPADIVKTMMTGTNTTVGLATSLYSDSQYQIAHSALSPMWFKNEIQDEADGAVLRTIQQISDPLDAVFAFDRAGNFIWLPHRPYGRSIDVVMDYYDDLPSGTDNISGQFTYTEDTEQVFTDFKIRYNYDVTEDEPLLQYKSEYEEFRSVTSERYNNVRSAKNIDTPWIHDENEAVVIADRFLNKHAFAPKKVTMHSSLYAIEQDLLNFVSLTHRSGSLTNVRFRVDGLIQNLDDDTVSMTLTDLGDQLGYGFWMDGTSWGSKVSGTSTAGWAWPETDFDHRQGTINFATIIGGLGSPLFWPNGTHIHLTDKNGSNIWDINGNSDYFWIMFGEEFVKVAPQLGSMVFVSERAAITTIQGTGFWIGTQFCLWYYDKDTNEVIPTMTNGSFWNLNPTGVGSMHATVHNINTGSYGSVWRWW